MPEPTRTPNGEPMPVASWLVKLASLDNVAGKEAGMQVVNWAPGAVNTPHYHPEGHEWVYIASGTFRFTHEGEPERELRAGDAFYIPRNVVHHGRNGSQTEPLKLVIFRVKDEGQPMLVRK